MAVVLEAYGCLEGSPRLRVADCVFGNERGRHRCASSPASLPAASVIAALQLQVPLILLSCNGPPLSTMDDWS